MRGTLATGFNSSQSCKIIETENTCKRVKHFKFSFCSLPYDFLWSLVQQDPTLLLCYLALLRWRQNVTAFAWPLLQTGGLMFLPSVIWGRSQDGLCLWLLVPWVSYSCHAPVTRLEVKPYDRTCARWCFSEGRPTGHLGKKWCGMGGWVFPVAGAQIPTCIIAAAGSDDHTESRNGTATTKLNLV